MAIKKILEFCKKNIVWTIALFLAAAIFITSATMLVVHLMPEKNKYEQYIKEEPKLEQGPEGKPVENPVDFESLKAQNPDVCAWITVEGTNIN